MQLKILAVEVIVFDILGQTQFFSCPSCNLVTFFVCAYFLLFNKS